MLILKLFIGFLFLIQIYCKIVSKRLLSHTIEGTCKVGSTFSAGTYGTQSHVGGAPYQYDFNDLGGAQVLNSDLKQITVSYWRYRYSNKLLGYEQTLFQIVDTDGNVPKTRTERLFSTQYKQNSDGGSIQTFMKHGSGDWVYNFLTPHDDEEWVYEVSSIDIEAQQFRIYRFFSSDQTEINDKFSLIVFNDSPVSFDSPNLYLNIGTDYYLGTDASFCGKIRTFDIFFNLYIGDLSSRIFYTGLQNQGEFDVMKILHLKKITKYEKSVYIEDSSVYQGVIDLLEGVTVNTEYNALQFAEGTQIQLQRSFQIGHPFNSRVQSDYHLSAVFSFWIKIDPQVKQAAVYKKINFEDTHIFSFGFIQNTDLDYLMYINWLEANQSQKGHTVPQLLFTMESEIWNKITFSLNSEYPTYEYRYTLIIGDREVKLTIEPDAQLTRQTLGNPRLFDANNDQFKDFLGDKNISNFLGEKFYLKDFAVYAGTTILINPQAGQTIDNCTQAIRIASTFGEFTCILCEVGFAVTEEGGCTDTCPEGTIYFEDTRTCDITTICAPKCLTCEPGKPSKCLTCAGNRVDGVDRDFPGNENVNPACTCPLGYFEAVDEQPDCVQYLYNDKTSSGYFEYSLRKLTYAALATSTPGEGDREFEQQVNFNKPFNEVPQVVIGFLNYELTDSSSIAPAFKIEVIDINEEFFIAKLTLREGCKMKQMSFSYFANNDLFIYKTGSYLWNSDETTDLSTGTGDRSYVKEISVSGWQGILEADIMLFVNGVTITDKTKEYSYGCTLAEPLVQNGEVIDFKISYNAFNGALVKELECGYIVYPKQFGISRDQEIVFSNTDDYVNTQHQQNSKLAVHETFIQGDSVNLQKDLFFGALQESKQKGTSGAPDAGASIPFGVSFSPRISDSFYKIKYVTGFNSAISYKANMLVPQKLCDMTCETCLLFDAGFGPCKQCNVEIANADEFRSPIAPYCGCKEGYFDRISDRLCSACQTQCKTCKYEAGNCLECAANRINFPTCDCSDPEHRFDSITTAPFYSPWCSTCQIGVPAVTIDGDYSIVNIIFDYEISFVDFPVHIDQYVHSYEICDILFGIEMLQLLGRGPLCAMNSSDNGLEVYLGGRPPIFPGDLVYFEPGKVRVTHSDCDNKTLDDIFDGYLQFLGTLEVPEIEITYPLQPISTCEPIEVQIEGLKKDFNKGLKSTKWKFLSITPEPNTQRARELYAFIENFENKNFLRFESGFLDENSTYEIELSYKTFIGQDSTATFSFQTKQAIDDLNLSFEVRDYEELYVWQNIILQTNFYIFNCTTGEKQVPEESVIQWEQLDNTAQNLTVNAIYNEVLEQQIFSEIVLPQYTAIPGQSYQIQFQITAMEITKTAVQVITFQESNLVTFIVGGDKSHAISEELEIELYFDDPDVDPQDDQTVGTTVSWSCNEDTIDGATCQKFDLTGDLVNSVALQDSYQFTIDAYQLHLYKLYYIQYDLAKGGVNSQGHVLIIGSDVSVPKLDIKFPAQYYLPKSGIALNSDIFCDLSAYTISPEEKAKGITTDKLKYSVSIIYENQIRATVKFNHNLTKFKLWEYFSDIRRDSTIELRYQIFNPLYLKPFQQKVKIRANSPPFNCRITVDPASSFAIDTMFTISVNRCLDLDDSASQLVYRYFAYYSALDIISEKKNAKETKAVILSEKTKKNYISTFLPQGSSDNDFNLQIMVQVEDVLGSLTNFTKPVQVTKNLSQKESEILDKLDAKFVGVVGLPYEQQIGQMGFLIREMKTNAKLVETEDVVIIKRMQNFKKDIIQRLRNMLNVKNFDSDEQILNIIYSIMTDNNYIREMYQQEIIQLVSKMWNICKIMKENGDSFNFDGSRTQQQTNELEAYKKISYKMLNIVDIIMATLLNPKINPDTESYIPPKVDNEGRLIPEKRNLYLMIDGEYADGEDHDGEIVGEVSLKIEEILYNLTLILPKILCFDQYANDESRNFSGFAFSSMNQKVDRINLNRNYLQISSLGSPYETAPTWLQEQFYENDDKTYLVSFKVFHYNPFKLDTKLFPWTRYNKFYDPFIQEVGGVQDITGENFERIFIDMRISHLFQYVPKNVQGRLVCVSLEQDLYGQNVFVNTTCTQHQVLSLDRKTYYMNCLCNTLGITTLVDDVEGVFTDYDPVVIVDDGEENEVTQMFIHDTGTTFLQWAVFWLFLIFTVAWMLLSLQGYHMDLVDGDFFIKQDDYRMYIKNLKEADIRNEEIANPNKHKDSQQKLNVEDEKKKLTGEEYQDTYTQNTPPLQVNFLKEGENTLNGNKQEKKSNFNKQNQNIEIENDKNINLGTENMISKDTEKRLIGSRSSRRTESSQSSRSKFSLDLHNEQDNLKKGSKLSGFGNLQINTVHPEGSPVQKNEIQVEQNNFPSVGQKQLSGIQQKYIFLESQKKYEKDQGQIDDNFKKLWWSYIPKGAQNLYADEEEQKKLNSCQPIREIVPPPNKTSALDIFLKSNFRGLVYFHRYTSPVALFNTNVHRPIRVTVVYFNMIMYFMLTGLLANGGMAYYSIFGITCLLYIVVGIFDILAVKLLNSTNFIVKWGTFFFIMCVTITCIVLGIDNAKLIHDDEISEWGIGYTLTILNEFFIMGMIDAVICFKIFKWSIRNQDTPKGAKGMKLVKGYLVIDNINSFSPEGIEEQLAKQQQKIQN